jgi:hypothetical protein
MLEINSYKKTDPRYDTLEQQNEWIAIAAPHCEEEHARVEEAQRMVRGYQWSEGDLQRQKDRERPALPLNSLHKLLNAVANREIMERIVPKVYGRDDDDNAIAEVLDAATQWQRSIAETEHEESMAFRSSCAAGYGVMHKWWDPIAYDGDGCIRDEEIPIWFMLWDPSARKQNLVDRRFHMCGKFVDIKVAEAMFGDLSKEAKAKFRDIKHTPFEGADTSDLTDQKNFGIGTWGQILGNRWLSHTGKEVFVVESEWKEVQTFYRVAVPTGIGDWLSLTSGEEPVQVDLGDGTMMDTEQFMAMSDEEQNNVRVQLMAKNEIQKFETREEFKPIVEQWEFITGEKFQDFSKERKEITSYCIRIDDVILDSGERPMGYTYEFLTGFPFETRDTIQFYGMIDVAKGPQDMKNAFYSSLLTMYMTSPKQHLMVEEGALNDVEQFLDEWAKVTGVSVVPDGFFQSKRFELMRPPTFPPMLSELISIAENAVQDIFGLSSIEMNTQGDLRRVSGNVVSAAKAASNTLLAILFDALRRYRKRWGMMSIKYMTYMYEPDEIKRIVGEDNAKYAEGIQAISDMDTWPDYLKFDIKIDESPVSVSEQIETCNYLVSSGTIDKWQAQGVPFELLLDLLVTIPQATRDKIKEGYSQMQQLQSQMQAAQAEIQKKAQKEELFRKYVSTLPEGGTLLAQFDYIENEAQAMAQEIQNQQQEQQSQDQEQEQPQE